MKIFNLFKKKQPKILKRRPLYKVTGRDSNLICPKCGDTLYRDKYGYWCNCNYKIDINDVDINLIEYDNINRENKEVY